MTPLSDLNLLLNMARGPLTRAERRYLQAMKDDPVLELEWAPGGGWWLGDRRVSAGIAWKLIRRSAISRSDANIGHGPGDIERWRPNGIGLALLEGRDPSTALVPETLDG